jgi:hypothetical protein
MAAVIGSLPGVLLDPIRGNGIEVVSILSEFVGGSGPPSLRWLRYTKDCVGQGIA